MAGMEIKNPIFTDRVSAGREGFEPSVDRSPQQFSRLSHSTTLAPPQISKRPRLYPKIVLQSCIYIHALAKSISNIHVRRTRQIFSNFTKPHYSFDILMIESR